MMERIGHWLAGWSGDNFENSTDHDKRVKAVIERVDGIEARVGDLERKEEHRGNEQR